MSEWESSDSRALSLVGLRPMRKRLKPDRASWMANSLPIPPVGPVTIAQADGPCWLSLFLESGVKAKVNGRENGVKVRRTWTSESGYLSSVKKPIEASETKIHAPASAVDIVLENRKRSVDQFG